MGLFRLFCHVFNEAHQDGGDLRTSGAALRLQVFGQAAAVGNAVDEADGSCPRKRLFRIGTGRLVIGENTQVISVSGADADTAAIAVEDGCKLFSRDLGVRPDFPAT